MPGFPPEEGSLAEKIKWYLYPTFPSLVLTVVDKTAPPSRERPPKFVGESYYDEEVEYLFKSESVSVLRLKRGDSIKTIASLIDPIEVATIEAPGTVFWRHTSRWTTMWIIPLYTVYFSLLVVGALNIPALSILGMLLIYIMSVRSFRFWTQSVRSIVLHEVGVLANLPLYVPGPWDHSTLSMAEILKRLRVAEVEIRDRMVAELLKDLEAQREVNNRLRALIARIERQSDMIYDMSHRLAEYLSKDYIERLSKEYDAQLARARRFYLLMAIAMLVLGAVIGMTLASGLGVSLSPPPQAVQTPLPPPR